MPCEPFSDSGNLGIWSIESALCHHETALELKPKPVRDVPLLVKIQDLNKDRDSKLKDVESLKLQSLLQGVWSFEPMAAKGYHVTDCRRS